MKKMLYALWFVAALYLMYHVVLFSANAPYRERLHNKDYIEGRTTVTYYSSVWH